jgi:copper chaperone CopZ
MNVMTRALALSLLALPLSVTPMFAQEVDSKPAAEADAAAAADIVLRVDGLACPFCAYGLERKLKSLDATDRVEVKLNEGEVFLFLKADQTVDDETLTKAVEDAGFVVRSIRRRSGERRPGV